MILATFLVTLAPLLALTLLGALELSALLTAPVWVAATLRTLLLAEAAVPMALCIGYAGAFGLWGAPRLPRLGVLSASILPLLMPPGWVADGLVFVADRLPLQGAHLAALMAAHTLPATSLAFLVFCAAFNAINPQLMEMSATLGASGSRAWRLVILPHLIWAGPVASCAAFAGAIAATTADGVLAPAYHPTLATLLSVAAATNDARTAATAFVLAILGLAPLALLAMLSCLLRSDGMSGG